MGATNNVITIHGTRPKHVHTREDAEVSCVQATQCREKQAGRCHESKAVAPKIIPS